MAKIRFGKPYDSSVSRTDHHRYTYPYEIVTESEGMRRDDTSEKRVTVEISDHVRAMWEKQADAAGNSFPGLKLVLFPFAVDAIGEASKSGELQEEITKNIVVDDLPDGRYPYDPGNVEEPEGQEYEVEFPSTGSMGFDVGG